MVRLGDPLLPILFNMLLEDVFRQLEGNRKSPSINGNKILNVKFADDVVLILETKEEMTKCHTNLINRGEKRD